MGVETLDGRDAAVHCACSDAQHCCQLRRAARRRRPTSRTPARSTPRPLATTASAARWRPTPAPRAAPSRPRRRALPIPSAWPTRVVSRSKGAARSR